MNKHHSLTLAGILTMLGLCLQFLRTQGIVTTKLVLGGLLLIAALMLDWCASWGFTQYMKFTGPDPRTLNAAEYRKWQQRVYKIAVFSAFCVSVVEGSVLLLIFHDVLHIVIYSILWLIVSLVMAVLSPIIWKLVFEYGIPWLKEK